jgi:hypothetical protein
VPDFVLISKIVQKSRVQATMNSAGGDFSQYHGDYGEDDMDVDFAGQLEDEEEGDTNKKKKKKEESTLASRDYGKRNRSRTWRWRSSRCNLLKHVATSLYVVGDACLGFIKSPTASCGGTADSRGNCKF